MIMSPLCTQNGPALGQRIVSARSVDRPHYVSHIGVVPERNNKFRLIHRLYRPQEPLININYHSH